MYGRILPVDVSHKISVFELVGVRFSSFGLVSGLVVFSAPSLVLGQGQVLLGQSLLQCKLR